MASYLDLPRLLDRTNLHGIVLALRGEMGDFQPPGTPDPALTELIDQPFDSVPGAVDQLAALESQLRTRDDRRAVFLTIYVRMTRTVQAGIDAGQFHDSEWMQAYLIAFANYYRRAFLAFERADLEAVPDPWQIAFGTAFHGNGLVLQDALLGVNAHINYDLALAIRDVGTEPNRDRKYADHRRIDGILDRLLNAQQDALAEIYAAGIQDIDTAGADLDESLMLQSMVQGREQAWRIAVILTDLNVAPVAASARWLLRATATGGGYFILSPHLNPAVVKRFHAVEEDQVNLEWMLDRVDQAMDRHGD